MQSQPRATKTQLFSRSFLSFSDQGDNALPQEKVPLILDYQTSPMWGWKNFVVPNNAFAFSYGSVMWTFVYPERMVILVQNNVLPRAGVSLERRAVAVEMRRLGDSWFKGLMGDERHLQFSLLNLRLHEIENDRPSFVIEKSRILDSNNSMRKALKFIKSLRKREE